MKGARGSDRRMQNELKDFYRTGVEVQPTHKSASPRLGKSFFQPTFPCGLSTLDTLYLFDTFSDLITEAAAALKGRFVGAARKGHGISLKAALPRQWVEIWREMWNCKRKVGEGMRKNSLIVFTPRCLCAVFAAFAVCA